MYLYTLFKQRKRHIFKELGTTATEEAHRDGQFKIVGVYDQRLYFEEQSRRDANCHDQRKTITTACPEHQIGKEKWRGYTNQNKISKNA